MDLSEAFGGIPKNLLLAKKLKKRKMKIEWNAEKIQSWT